MTNPPGDIAAWKREARLWARAQRALGDPALSGALAAHLLPALPPAPGAVIGGVWPLPGELDARPLMHDLHARGHCIALPVTPPRGFGLSFRVWEPGIELVQGRFGTFHTEGQEVIPDYILVPLLAFDRRGHRLGYGAGHYDRTLAALPHAVAVGFAFAAQEMPRVWNEPTDRALHAIVTERELIISEPSA